MVCVKEKFTENRVRFSINGFLGFVHIPGIDVHIDQNLLETRSVSVLKWKDEEAHTQSGLLYLANLNDWRSS
jgi:hypothetical protein